MAKTSRGATHSLIRIKSAGQPDRLEDLLGTSYSFGRGDPEGKIRVDFVMASDQHLSREHCRLQRKDDSYFIENLSPNGTYVNGKEVVAPRPLKHKDKIEIGSGTSLEFLRLSDAERSRELHGAVADKEVAKAAEGEGKKSILASPWLWGMLVFYGLIGVVVASAVGKKEKVFAKPKGGPFFDHLMSGELHPDPTEPAEVRKRRANEIWSRAQRLHGGETLTTGANAYYLVQEAQHALRELGFKSVNDAINATHPIASAARDAISQLEARVGDWYAEANQYFDSRHWAEARRRYARIEAAIPDRSVPVRKYAAYWAHRLRKFK
ncbi:MAG: FHA domain-containing protein [Planctomycetota bacterium]|nr:FHA domain-containing protein [Planctomycetota bacterium]